jgi:Arc/MetJ family transcription regulator
MVRTTLDIDPKLLAEALEWTGETSPGRVVNKALEELVRREKMKKLIELVESGAVYFEGDPESWEKAELEEWQTRL